MSDEVLASGYIGNVEGHRRSVLVDVDQGDLAAVDTSIESEDRVDVRVGEIDLNTIGTEVGSVAKKQVSINKRLLVVSHYEDLPSVQPISETDGTLLIGSRPVGRAVNTVTTENTETVGSDETTGDVTVGSRGPFTDGELGPGVILSDELLHTGNEPDGLVVGLVVLRVLRDPRFIDVAGI